MKDETRLSIRSMDKPRDFFTLSLCHFVTLPLFPPSAS